MKQPLAVILAAVFVLSALVSDVAVAAPKGNLQLGFGANQIQGAPMMGLDWKNPMLYAGGMYFPSSWAVLIADISYGLENEYEQTEGTDTEKFKGQSGYADFMFGAVKHFADGGFLYASLGAAVGWASVEMSGRDGGSRSTRERGRSSEPACRYRSGIPSWDSPISSSAASLQKFMSKGLNLLNIPRPSMPAASR